MFRTIVFSQLLILTLAAAALPDATVVQSGSPTFPLQVDKITLSVPYGCPAKRGQDSVTARLPVALYEDVRNNIDTIFTYADALRRHRPELAASPEDASVRPRLTIEYMGICVMRLFFQNSAYKSGKLVAAVDRYPFVVVLTRGFAARMKKLAAAGKK
jgi:hypothetical protein